MTLPANLPALLRAEGLRVVEHDGWRKRGRPGPFAPVGVLCHHTATPKSASDAAVCRLLIVGRSDLPGPLSQIGLARDGTVHLIAAGRANHAGTAQSSGTVAAGDGNTLYIGIEAFNDGVGEPWPAVQYDAYVTLAAALSKHVTGNSAQTVRGHKETSVTGKIDPRFDMDTFRARVDDRITDRDQSEEDDMPSIRELLDEPLNKNEPKGTLQSQGVTVGEALTLLPIIAEQLGGKAGEALERFRQSKPKG
jgi:hypothetical protein